MYFLHHFFQIGDQPFADVYKIQGLRGIYVASQIINIADPKTIRQTHSQDLLELRAALRVLKRT